MWLEGEVSRVCSAVWSRVQSGNIYYNESLIHFESGTRTDSRDSLGYAVLLIGVKNSIADLAGVPSGWLRMSSIYICVWNVSKGEAE